MGMDIDEYSDRSLEIGEDLMELCGDMYAAIDEKVPLDDVNTLLKAGSKKIELFEKLSVETSGGMREGLHKKYESYMKKIANYSKQLKEIYHD
jgi:hypothetical protein